MTCVYICMRIWRQPPRAEASVQLREPSAAETPQAPVGYVYPSHVCLSLYIYLSISLSLYIYIYIYILCIYIGPLGRLGGPGPAA